MAPAMVEAFNVEDVVRVHVYDVALRTGAPPLVSDIAAALRLSVAQTTDALLGLAQRRVLVLQPSGEILMAMPFSAVPTPFAVTTPTYSAFANCAWDALGIAAMTDVPVAIRSSCADCGEALAIDVRGGTLSGTPVLLHFALPVRKWWESVGFT